MINFFFMLFLLFFLQNCSKPKTVLICGDHICINKKEAEQYFEDNLSIEVKIINKKKNNETDLVELNLKNSSNINKEITMKNKTKTNKNIKVLDNEEIKILKKKIIEKERKKKIVKKKSIERQQINNNVKKNENTSIKEKSSKIAQMNVNKRKIEVVDVCKIIEKCNIEEISKYLLDQSNKKGFPDITIRE